MEARNIVTSASTEKIYPPASAALAARMLEGSWRKAPAPVEGDPSAAAALLIDCGAGALLWHRLCTNGTRVAEDVASRLRNETRVLAIKEAVNDLLLSRFTGVLNDAGIEPLLFKGWAVARSYGASYLRPYGDFDILVRREQLALARQTLAPHGRAGRRTARGGEHTFHAAEIGKTCAIDLHATLPEQYRSPTDEIMSRARGVRLAGGQRFMVPAPEDHLRIVALHFLRHGGWRPIWLCDIAALAEEAGPDFDWTLCLTSDAVTCGWIAAAIAAARELLGCRMENGARELGAKAPRWLVEALLEQWRRPNALRTWAPPIALSARYARCKLSERWPSPISAAFMQRRNVEEPCGKYRQLSGFLINVAHSLQNLLDEEWRPSGEAA